LNKNSVYSLDEISNKSLDTILKANKFQKETKIASGIADGISALQVANLTAEVDQTHRLENASNMANGMSIYTIQVNKEQIRQTATLEETNQESKENNSKAVKHEIQLKNIKIDLKNTQIADDSTIAKVKCFNCLTIFTVVAVIILLLAFIGLIIYIGIR